MNALRFLFRLVFTAFSVASLLASTWAALASPPVGERQAQEKVLAESDGCYSLGERVAVQNSGTLARATAASQSEQQVCIVVVLVPAKDGQRPRRFEIAVPLD